MSPEATSPVSTVKIRRACWEPKAFLFSLRRDLNPPKEARNAELDFLPSMPLLLEGQVYYSFPGS